jgi:predicted RNA-binding Zn-ribbon protein involved in translation (DUF1610 family)
MANSTYFVQECPTCGRRLMIRVEYLGRKMVCQHCQGLLIASDPATVRADCPDHGAAILQRADELLRSAAKRKPQPHSPNPR